MLAAHPAAASITGTVVDSTGAPIATARVDAYHAVPQYFAMMLIRKSSELRSMANAKTDAQGTFALDLAGHGVADIHVTADGYAPFDVVADPRGSSNRMVRSTFAAGATESRGSRSTAA